MSLYFYCRRIWVTAFVLLSGCGGGGDDVSGDMPANAPMQVVVDGYAVAATPYANIYNQNSAGGFKCPSSEYGLAFKVSPAIEPTKLQGLIKDILVFRGMDGRTTLPATQSIKVMTVKDTGVLGAVVGGSACVQNELAVGDLIWMVVRFSENGESVLLKSDIVKVIPIS